MRSYHKKGGKQMANIRVVKTTKQFEEYARKAAEENKGSVVDLGASWCIKASPKLVFSRRTFDDCFKDRPIWERNALWLSLPLVTEGAVTKLADDEIILEDPT